MPELAYDRTYDLGSPIPWEADKTASLRFTILYL
jgi:hypothetical protein